MFEGGKLKGESTPKVGAATPSIKQHHLQPLHHLPQDFQVRHCLQMYMYPSCSSSVSPMITSHLEMFQKLNALQLHFSEMSEAATKFRGLQVAKSTFTKITGCSTWNEAAAKFPHHAVEEQMKAFAGLSFKGRVSEVFKQYCRAAMTTEEDSEGGNNDATTFHVKGCATHIVKCDKVAEYGGVMRKLPNFCGSNLRYPICQVIHNVLAHTSNSLCYTGNNQQGGCPLCNDICCL